MDIIQQLRKETNKELPLTDRIYEELLRDILTGKLARDSWLTETKVCSMYGASRTPVREAFRRLEMDGLLEYIPKRGEYVRGFSYDELIDMLNIRADLEVRAVSWSIERITDDEMEQFDDIFRYMEFYTKKNDIHMMMYANSAFHRHIYKTSHDRMLDKTLTTYFNYCKYSCPPNYFAPKFLDKTLEERRRIYSAYLKKDVASGARAMKLHMSNTIKRAIANINLNIYEK